VNSRNITMQDILVPTAANGHQSTRNRPVIASSDWRVLLLYLGDLLYL